jgi:predicted dinucleotide-binding enzyme
MNISVVGAGRVGTAMAVLLGRAGHRIVAVSGRGPTRDRASRFLSDVPPRSRDAARAGELVVSVFPMT